MFSFKDKYLDKDDLLKLNQSLNNVLHLLEIITKNTYGF